MRRATPEDPCLGKAAKAVQAQCEPGGPDPVARLLATGAPCRVQVAEKDECDVEIFRIGPATLVDLQLSLGPGQRHPLAFARPKGEEQALSHRP